MQEQTRANPTADCHQCPGSLRCCQPGRAEGAVRAWGSHSHYPSGAQAPVTGCSAHRHAGCTAALAGLQWTVPRGCVSTPRTRCPSCRELWFLQTATMELLRHGFLPTLHPADSSWTLSSCLQEKLVWFDFPTSHLPTESTPKACRCLVPFPPMENSFLWRALGIHHCPMTQAAQAWHLQRQQPMEFLQLSHCW